MEIHGQGHTIKNTFIHLGEADEELQSWKEHFASISEELPSGEDELKPLLQFLVKTICPAKIYKLKHTEINQAAGQYIDLLVIVSGKNNRPFTELESILEMPYIKQQTICCSLHSERNLLEAL